MYYFGLYLRSFYMLIMTKINNILQLQDKNSILFSSWLTKQGLSTSEISQLVVSGWLDRIAQGVYKFKGASPTLYDTIHSYNDQLGKHCYIGAGTALDLRGYYHFIPMGKQPCFLFTPKNERLPLWINTLDWDMTIQYFTTNIFGDDGLGLENNTSVGMDLTISSPERAIMECLYLCPKYFSQMDVYYLMETLSTLRPVLVQEILEHCTSVKVKRLFMYMAERSGFQWFKSLNIPGINLGSGARIVEKNGVYNSKYQITISKELASYE